jgi:lysophospholipase L1-like esterase
LPSPGNAQTVAVSNGQSIAFLGDSITAQGASAPGGYARLVLSGLECVGIKATMIPAGVSGHKSNDMLKRLSRDVLNKKPAWMTLSCGVNDVWHGNNGVPLDAYKTNITAVVDGAQAQGIRVMILTATMVGEDAANPNNQKLAAYNEFLRELAAEKKCILADLNADMQKAVEEERARGKNGNLLTSDGVHMNAEGNKMMALGVLRAFGLSDTELQDVRERWMDVPGTVRLPVAASLSWRQQARLQALADERKISVPNMIQAEFDKSLAHLLDGNK